MRLGTGTLKRSGDHTVAGIDVRFAGVIPERLGDTVLARELRDEFCRVAAQQRQLSAPARHVLRQAGQGALQPPVCRLTGSAAQGAVALVDEDQDERPARLDGGVQRWIIGEAQVAAKPDERCVGGGNGCHGSPVDR